MSKQILSLLREGYAINEHVSAAARKETGIAYVAMQRDDHFVYINTEEEDK